jgi:hypothetical protein
LIHPEKLIECLTGRYCGRYYYVKSWDRNGGVSEVIELSKFEALSSNPSTTKKRKKHKTQVTRSRDKVVKNIALILEKLTV